jgi:hypothetical protein
MKPAPAVAPSAAFAASLAVYLLSEGAALADVGVADSPFNGVQANSLYVTLALFLMSVPGRPHRAARCPPALAARCSAAEQLFPRPLQASGRK